jgi:phosphate transport system substrate-binding protein
MPPEVKAALAEQSYTCVEGDTKLSAPEAIAAVAGDWQSSVESNCAGMTISPVANIDSQVELQIGAVDSKNCTPYASVPFAVDGVVLAVNLTDITNVNLSAQVIEEIWAGKITTWNDPAIVELNPNFQMPATAISFGSEISAEQAKPFTDWLGRLAGHPVKISGGSTKLTSLSEGGIVLASYSDTVTLGLPMVGISSGKGSEGVVPEIGSINSAASMYQAKSINGLVSLTFNPKAKPIAPEGVAAAPAPYQAVSVINLNLCGVDSLKTRAAARYILRQDSQGSLGLSTVVGIPENLRIIALDAVSVGLPEPVITQAPAQ